MENIFEIIDKTSRKIRLTKRQWSHIRKKHPEVENHEEIIKAIRNPDKIIKNLYDESINHYYKYFKEKKSPNQFLLVLVKYLNGDGFVVTAYFEKNIK